MTVQEANDWCDQFRDNIIMTGVKKEKYTLALRAMRTAMTALAKQMPKKVVFFYPRDFSANCPECDKRIEAHANHKYCCWCGQRLEWSDDDVGELWQNDST